VRRCEVRIPPATAALFDVLQIFRPALSAPSFANMVVLVAGWVLTGGRHAVTEALVASRVSARRHHAAFHGFFAYAAWSIDELGLALAGKIAAEFDGPLFIAIDDTLASKKGPEVFGIGCHIDAVRSTRNHKIFSFGHVWVTLAILIPVPFSTRRWALPVLFSLYRNKKECEKAGDGHLKKTERAKRLLGVLLARLGDRQVCLAMDNAYCCGLLLKDLPDNVTVYGAMRSDAALCAPPPPRRARRGRPSLYGKRLPDLDSIAKDAKMPWKKTTAFLYGEKHRVTYKTLTAQWRAVCEDRLLRIVLIKCVKGNIPFRVVFSTENRDSASAVISGYGHRWNIEVTFRELKQELGFADSSARKPMAVLRTAPFVGLVYSALVLWFLDRRSGKAELPARPWYRQKQGVSFADILRAAQRSLQPLDIIAVSGAMLDVGGIQANATRLTRFPSKSPHSRARLA
jgi:hypothetical protein